MQKLNATNLDIIAFDADDTLWVNETFYRNMENKFCDFLSDFGTPAYISAELFKTEVANLSLYGFGAKAFVLSNIETFIRIAGNKTTPAQIQKILDLGKELVDMPMELLDGVNEVLQKLSSKYKLVVATKGDLLDQERKLRKSGLEKYFHHIEIMSDKKTSDYEKMFDRLSCDPSKLMMIGNSMKSDIMPILELGGYGVYVPFHTVWAHEVADDKIEHPRLYKISHITELSSIIDY